jgi:hypothetical protein
MEIAPSPGIPTLVTSNLLILVATHVLFPPQRVMASKPLKTRVITPVFPSLLQFPKHSSSEEPNRALA